MAFGTSSTRGDGASVADALVIRDLHAQFHTRRGVYKALNGVNLRLRRGEVLGIAGESGCGKTTMGLAGIGLLPRDAWFPQGQVIFDNNDLMGIEDQVLSIWRRDDVHISRKEKAIRSLAGQQIRSVERNIIETVARTGSIPPRFSRVPVLSRVVRRVFLKEGYRKARELLTSLGIPHAERVLKMYPHELSGGMRQRVVIAIALVNNPEVIIMDEPTSAVDVTVQAQILELVKRIRTSVSAAFIVISHDLAVLAEVSDRIAIMYAGRIVEIAPTDKILRNPLHPYTQLLIS